VNPRVFTSPFEKGGVIGGFLFVGQGFSLAFKSPSSFPLRRHVGREFKVDLL